MIDTNEFKNGMTIIVGTEVFSIVYFQHVKPGKGAAFVRTRLRSIKNGNIIERTFRAGEKFKQAFIEQKKIQFLYRQGSRYHFMDQQTFDELELPKERLSNKVGFLKENMVLTMEVYNGSIVDIKLPNFVNLKIIQAEPGVRANTVKTPSKQATLETGARIAVPLFVEKGNTIKIDTRSGKYISRV
jgi:elongation factor P